MYDIVLYSLNSHMNIDFLLKPKVISHAPSYPQLESNGYK